MSELEDIRDRVDGFVPGPWYQTGDSKIWKDYRDEHCLIAHAAEWDESDANTALMAAAPDILRIATELTAERDALREALELMLRRYGYETCEYVQKAMAALGEDKP